MKRKKPVAPVAISDYYALSLPTIDFATLWAWIGRYAYGEVLAYEFNKSFDDLEAAKSKYSVSSIQFFNWEREHWGEWWPPKYQEDYWLPSIKIGGHLYEQRHGHFMCLRCCGYVNLERPNDPPLPLCEQALEAAVRERNATRLIAAFGIGTTAYTPRVAKESR